MRQKISRTQSFNSEQQRRLRQQELARRVETGQQATLIRGLLDSWLQAEQEEVLDKLRRAGTADELVVLRGHLLGIDSFADHLKNLVNQGENAMASIASSIPETD